MRGEHADTFIRMCTDAAEMNDFFYTGRGNRFFITFGDIGDSRHVIQVGVKEKRMTERFHTVNYVSAGKSFAEKSSVIHGPDSSLCSYIFNSCLPFGATADHRYLVTVFN